MKSITKVKIFLAAIFAIAITTGAYAWAIYPVAPGKWYEVMAYSVSGIILTGIGYWLYKKGRV